MQDDGGGTESYYVTTLGRRLLKRARKAGAPWTLDDD